MYHFESFQQSRSCLRALLEICCAGLLGASACSSNGSATGGTAGLTGTAGAPSSGGVSGSAGSAGEPSAAGGALGGASAAQGGGAGSGETSAGQGGAANGSGGTANLAGAGGAPGAQGGSAGGGAPGAFVLTSSAFTAGMQVPLKYKCAQNAPAGMNLSPPLSWTPGPAGTQSYAVTLNHVGGGDHWAVWDIPASTTALPENIDHVATPSAPAGTQQSVSNLDGFNGNGYEGPCPQAVNSTQMYVYTVWALGVATLSGVTAQSSTTAAQAAIKGAALPGGSATLTGTQTQTK